MSPKFRGILGQTFEGFYTVRGYAEVGDLVRYSITDPSYQRDLGQRHKAEIKTFYERGEFLFFPELVLSLELRVDYTKDITSTADPLILVHQDRQVFHSNVDGVEIKPIKASQNPPGVIIIIPEEAGKVLKRIDGNHRLSAFAELKDPKYDKYQAPFCIVLFRSVNARQSEKTLFYNINSKAMPLSSEEVFKGIIDDDKGFPDDELLKDFGEEFVLCRQVRNQLDFTYLSDLRNVFGQGQDAIDNRCTVVINSLKVHKNKLQGQALPSVQSVLTSIQAVNRLYNQESKLSGSDSVGLFSSFLHFSLSGGSNSSQFAQWVLKNQIYELRQVDAEELIRIFESVAKSRKRQIFVSMQFSQATTPNFHAISAAVDDVNGSHPELDIKLREIRMDQLDTGFSYEINDEILRLIEESGLLIADLTGGNKNVYHEIGYLMGLNKGKGLTNENFLLIHNSNISNANDDISFNVGNFKQVRVNDTNSIRVEVRKQIEIYYGLS